jgi:glucokinase
MIVGIDLGGTRIKIGLVDQGKLIDSKIVDAESTLGLQRQLPKIESIIRDLRDQHIDNINKLVGVGSTFPGIVDSKSMKVLSTNTKYPDAAELDLKAWVREVFSVPFVMDNDARLSLLGEWQYGAGRGCDDLVMITLGTGIGGAALMEGRLVRGKHFVAGCLGGHFTINYHGKECQCGNIGCVESEASSWRLPELASNKPSFDKSRLSDLKEINYEEVFKLAEQGDDLAAEIKVESIRAWSFGMVNMIHAYDPEMVIVSGGIIQHNDEMIKQFQQIVNQHTWTPWGKVKVVKAQWPERNAILGCAYLLEKQLEYL